MSEVNLAEPTPAAPADKGLAARGLFEVFTQPSTLFAKLKANPKILLPYLLCAAMTLIFFLLTADMIVNLQMNNPKFQEQMQNNPNMNLERVKPFMKMSIIGFGTISVMLVPLIAAALALFWGNFVMAGRAKFSEVLSVTLYGEVLYIFGGLILTLPLILAKGTLGPSFSPAILVAEKGIESPLYVALSKLSVFHIWEIVVLGIGYSIVFGFSKGKGWATALLSMGFLAVFHIVWTLIFT